jgi:hypothetical protein
MSDQACGGEVRLQGSISRWSSTDWTPDAKRAAASVARFSAHERTWPVSVTDCAIDVEGADLADLFETAASALAELMVDPATVQVALQRTIMLEAPELDLILYDWLSELIFRKDRDGEVYTRTKVHIRGRPLPAGSRAGGRLPRSSAR